MLENTFTNALLNIPLLDVGVLLFPVEVVPQGKTDEYNEERSAACDDPGKSSSAQTSIADPLLNGLIEWIHAKWIN
jgi:hypothetical protein